MECPAVWRKGRRGEGEGCFYWNRESWEEIRARAMRDIPDSKDGELWGIVGYHAEWVSLSQRQLRVMDLVETSDLLDRGNFKWRMAERCSNSSCIWGDPSSLPCVKVV
ncbi:hypothetical protein BKA70DRAFT_1296228 [Coprinopsis sp. MPI-PUGE-AT-0042]|nr:hypothetical protein BKA70DRAFT_1296228 [Coprinopsis sp. MPI-PUGE-AT-0042]